MNNTHLISLIEDQVDISDIGEIVIDKISDPYSDRSNPYQLNYIMSLDDNDNLRNINCVLVYDVEWQYYSDVNKYGDIPEDPPEHITIDSYNTEIENFTLIDIENIEYEPY